MKSKLFVLLIVFFYLAGCQNNFDYKVLKLAHGLDQKHPVHKAMLFMAEKIKEKSKGKLRIKIYPNQQLGTERECIELLQIGSLAMTKVSASALESFSPDFKVFSMPYLFKNNDHRFHVLEGQIGIDLLHELKSSLLLGLCYYDAGSRSFYTTNRMVHTPNDLKGMKIRVMQSATAVEMVNSLGGSATPIAAGELYSALQQGVVDGAENNFPTFSASHHYEICKYFSVDEHTSIPDVLVISVKVWEGLSANEKKWLSESVKESVVFQKKLWEEASDSALRKVKKAGVEIYYPDKGLFVKKVKQMYDKLEDGSKIRQLVKKIQEMN